MNFWNWITTSSANPEKVALTIKGAIVFIPTFLMLTQVFGWHSLDQATLTELINDFAAFISGAFMLYGLGRKIFYAVRMA